MESELGKRRSKPSSPPLTDSVCAVSSRHHSTAWGYQGDSREQTGRDAEAWAAADGHAGQRPRPRPRPSSHAGAGIRGAAFGIQTRACPHLLSGPPCLSEEEDLRAWILLLGLLAFLSPGRVFVL